jgi:hypothetical protein
VQLRRGESAAPDRLRAALDAADELGDPDVACDCLTGLAEVAATNGLAKDVGRLCGAAEARRTGASVNVLAEQIHGSMIAATRAAIGSVDWQAAITEGRAMSRPAVRTLVDRVVEQADRRGPDGEAPPPRS